MHAGDAHLSEALREGSAQAGSSRGRNRLRSGLVVAEIAFSMILLVGAGLMLRSFLKRYELQNHLHIAGVQTGAILLPVAAYPDNPSKSKFMHAVLPEIAALPGVQAVTAAQTLPLGRNGWGQSVLAEGAKDPDPKNAPFCRYGIVFPGYFDALGIPIKSGRDFQSTDTPMSQRVAIVSESMARKLWPGQDPIGRRLKFVGDPDSIGYASVVGLVADVLQNVEDQKSRLEEVYVPHDQNPVQTMSFIIRSHEPTGTLSAKIRDILRQHDPDLAFTDVRTMREHIDFSMWTHRLFTSLFAVFAVMALVIAGVGIYGVMSYSVGQRTQEIGIRMALGADQGSVVWMVTLQALWLTGIGIALGLFGAYFTSKAMAGQLFGVSPSDPPTFTAVCVLLALSGVVAAWVPAMRASRVNPIVALRYE
jgi:putative ABC transport system permease protein